MSADGHFHTGVYRGRQAGKTASMAEEISRRCGLGIDTVLELMQKGWSYEEHDKAPSRWVQDRVPRAPQMVIENKPYGMGGVVEAALSARIAYTRNPDGADLAGTWIEAENRLDDLQYLQYQQRFRSWMESKQ
jgi:hypothetical protein